MSKAWVESYFAMKKEAQAVSGVSTHPPMSFASGGCGVSFARTGYSRACERDAADRTRHTNPASRADVVDATWNGFMLYIGITFPSRDDKVK